MSQERWCALRDVQVPEDVARLLATVPEWFGQSKSNDEYIEAARTKETWTVRDSEGRVVGVTLVDRHFPHVAEVHLTVVDRSVHGAGVGTAMLSAIEAAAFKQGVAAAQPAAKPDAGKKPPVKKEDDDDDLL